MTKISISKLILNLQGNKITLFHFSTLKVPRKKINALAQFHVAGCDQVHNCTFLQAVLLHVFWEFLAVLPFMRNHLLVFHQLSA